MVDGNSVRGAHSVKNRVLPSGGKSSIPSELAEIDITDAVVKFDAKPFAARLFFDIYHGAWKLDTPRTIQHVVAIKILCPRDNADGQQEFEHVRKLRLGTLQASYAILMLFSLTFHLAAPQVQAELTHDNLVPLLGVSTAFGQFPPLITSWMTNGTHGLEVFAFL